MVQAADVARFGAPFAPIHEDLPLLTNAPYCASKGGLRMLMRTIAVELAPYKITVNNIGPGAIYTPIDNDVEEDKTMNDAILAEILLAVGDNRRRSGTWLSFLLRIRLPISPVARTSLTAVCCGTRAVFSP